MRGSAAALPTRNRPHTDRGRSVRQAPVVTWWNPPRFHRGFSLARFDGTSEAVDQHRASIALALGVGVLVDAVPTDAVARAVADDDQKAIARLVETSLKGIAEWLGREAAMAGGAARGDYLCIAVREGEKPSLFLEGYARYDIRLPLGEQPVELARVVYAALHLLGPVGLFCEARDLLDFHYWMQTRLEEISLLRKAGVIDNAEAAWDFLQKNPNETMEGFSKEELARELDEWRTWQTEFPEWMKVKHDRRGHGADAKRLALALWQLRTEHPDLYRSRLGRFARRALRLYRQYASVWTSRRAKARRCQWLPGNEEAMGVDMLNAITFGFGWETELVDDATRYVLEAGEEFSTTLQADGLAFSEVRDTLAVMAKVFGLLQFAEGPEE